MVGKVMSCLHVYLCNFAKSGESHQVHTHRPSTLKLLHKEAYYSRGFRSIQVTRGLTSLFIQLINSPGALTRIYLVHGFVFRSERKHRQIYQWQVASCKASGVNCTI